MRQAFLLALLIAWPMAVAAQNVPDPSLVHGKPLPAPELADGTLTVRVVREAMANSLPGQTVTVTAGSRTMTGRTNDSGRAEFTNVPRDTDVRAQVTVDGEMLVSESFRLPSRGGVRVALIAGLARAVARRDQEAAAARSAPPVRGVVTLGGNSRIIGEFQNDNLFLFYQLDIVNNARAPVDMGGPFELELPRGAAGATLMDGSPKTATINGRFLVVPGPFAPGSTTVNVQYQLRFSSSELTFTQRWPVSVEQLPVFIQRVGNVTFSSPQLQKGEDRVTEAGLTFASSAASGLPAGSELRVQLSNLPARSRVAEYVTLGLALAVIGLGVWLSMTARRGDAARQLLISRRDALLTRLEELEGKRRAGKVSDERYLARRQRLISDLEELYHELDEAGSRTQGGDEGVAA